MPRPKRRPLRGSVTQNNTATLRLSPHAKLSPAGFLIRLGVLVGGVLVAVGLIVWLWHESGAIGSASLRLTQRLHFAVRDVVVIGRQQTAKDAINAAIGVNVGDAILGVDPDAIQARVAALPWISSATVERRLPDTVIVRVGERGPMARWQHKGRNVVIDAQGHELADAKVEQFAMLPLVVGDGAEKNAKDLIVALRDAPTVAKNMTAATWVGDRRWDIYLQTKIVAKLPEGDVDDALKQLTKLIDQKYLDRDIISIDLRLSDRLIIEPSHAVPSRTSGDSRL